jgi:hypothetical protein
LGRQLSLPLPAAARSHVLGVPPQKQPEELTGGAREFCNVGTERMGLTPVNSASFNPAAAGVAFAKSA